MKQLVILIDSGDTLVDESTQTFDQNGDVLSAKLIPGAREALEHLRAAGHRVALVADGTRVSFERVHHALNIYDLFEARVYSGDMGCRKPDSRMFERAYELMNLYDDDKQRTFMVGNNLERDIVGSHGFGINGILINWSPRYNYTPKAPNEVPDYTVSSESELCALIDKLAELDGEAVNT